MGPRAVRANGGCEGILPGLQVEGDSCKKVQDFVSLGIVHLRAPQQLLPHLCIQLLGC